MTNEQSAGVSGILKVSGLVLVILRAKHDSEPGYWEFPKGKVEFGEDPDESIRREFMEETGLRVKTKRIIGTNSWTYGRDGRQIHVVEAVYEVGLENDEKIENLKLSKDHDEWKLVDKKTAKLLEPIVETRRNYLLDSLAA